MWLPFLMWHPKILIGNNEKETQPLSNTLSNTQLTESKCFVAKSVFCVQVETCLGELELSHGAYWQILSWIFLSCMVKHWMSFHSIYWPATVCAHQSGLARLAWSLKQSLPASSFYPRLMSLLHVASFLERKQTDIKPFFFFGVKQSELIL